jgi:peroxiredoxin
LGQLQSIVPQLRDLGYQLTAISPDRPDKLRESVEKNELQYALYSDSKMAAARAFGIAYRLDDATLQALAGFGIDVQEASGENHKMLPVPSVFVIDKGGKIAFGHVNPDYKKRLSAEVLLAVAKATVAD